MYSVCVFFSARVEVWKSALTQPWISYEYCVTAQNVRHQNVTFCLAATACSWSLAVLSRCSLVDVLIVLIKAPITRKVDQERTSQCVGPVSTSERSHHSKYFRQISNPNITPQDHWSVDVPCYLDCDSRYKLIVAPKKSERIYRLSSPLFLWELKWEHLPRARDTSMRTLIRQ